MKNSIFILLFFCSVISVKIYPTEPAHFMGSSLIFMPSTEDVGKKNLVFRFNHRFGNASPGFKNFFGLDEGANTQLALDYGITDAWMVGIARASQFKTTELRSKFKIISQSNFPFTVSIFGVAGQENSDQSIQFKNYNQNWTGNSILDSQINSNLNTYSLNTDEKRSYLSSILISRRFNSWLSIQLSPMHVHRNFTKSRISNDRTGISFGGRIKISRRVDICFESIFSSKRDYSGTDYETEDLKSSYSGLNQLTAQEINTGFSNGTISQSQAFVRNIILDQPVKYNSIPAAIGLDIETGGHVFQFFISNTRALSHTQLLRGAEYDIYKKEFNLGFNILRQFSFSSSQEEW